MADSEAVKINLAALRKVDSTISSIVDNGNQVALYKFISDANKWEKTEIEGTLFVYMRSQKPQHGFMIMNRLSTTNLVEPITENLDFKDETPFLLYRNDKGHIYSIWFYEEANCSKIYKLLMSLSQLVFTRSDKSSNNRQRSYSESNRKHQKMNNTQADIISILTRAQDEYDKKSTNKVSTKSSKTKQRSPNGEIVKPTPVRMNGAVTTPNGTTPLTIGMLFAQAGGMEAKFDKNSREVDSRSRSFTANSSSELLNSSKRSTEAILQSLLSNSAHTLQHIEGNQKVDNVAGDKNRDTELRALSAGGDIMMSVETLEKDLKEKLNILPKNGGGDNIECKGAEVIMAEPAKSDPIDIPILTPAMLECPSFSSVPVAKIGSFTENSENNCNCSTSFTTVKESRSFSPNQLLSPMDFTIPSVKKKCNFQSSVPSSYSPELGITFMNDSFSCGNGNGHEDLLHPQTLINGFVSGNPMPSSKPSTITPLNKNQLREALIYMLQNDEDFVVQIHECYIKRLKSQLHSINTS